MRRWLLVLLVFAIAVGMCGCGSSTAPSSLSVAPAILVEPVSSSLGRVTISGIVGKPTVIPDPGGYFSIRWLTTYTLLEVAGLKPTLRDTPAKLLVIRGQQVKIVQITVIAVRSKLVVTTDISELEF